MRRLIASPSLRVAALCWVVGFFVVFIPAHRRGMVTLPGHAAVAEGPDQAAPYCPLCVVSTQDGQPIPADAPVSCAICHLKAGLDVPAAVVLAPRFLAELTFLIERPEPAAAPARDHGPMRRGRAPPTV
jgi:hypothetical protein